MIMEEDNYKLYTKLSVFLYKSYIFIVCIIASFILSTIIFID